VDGMDGHAERHANRQFGWYIDRIAHSIEKYTHAGR
jgi:hypothetical protein